MSELKHMHAKTECLPFNTEDVRLIITERYGKQEIRMHGEDARFIVEAIAAAKRRTQPEATKPEPIPGLPFADLATPIKEFEARKAAALASPADALVAGDSETAKDAERYRWLRHGDNDEIVLVAYESNIAFSHFLPRDEKLDAAIDAAIQAQKDGHG